MFPSDWAELDKRVSRFIDELPPLDDLQQNAQQTTVARRLLVVHMLARGAIVELHEPLERIGASIGRAAPAALGIVQVLNHAVDARSGEALVDSMVGVRLSYLVVRNGRVDVSSLRCCYVGRVEYRGERLGAHAQGTEAE